MADNFCACASTNHCITASLLRGCTLMRSKKRKAPARTTMRSRGERAVLRPIGVIRSTIKKRSDAPKQASEGAPDVWLEIHPFASQAAEGIRAGDDIILITWLH